MSTALVLGAGGAFGWVFHAGVARALRARTGSPVGGADLLIGTSAGAAVAAALKADADPDEIIAAATRPPTPDERREMAAELRSNRRTWRPLAPGLLRHLGPGGNGAAVALSGVLPPGRFPTTFLERFPGVGEHREWPEGLWIPAVAADDGAVTVFGRDRTDVSVSEAVEASSAVPGIFRPKPLGGARFLDGGLVSPTHADLAVGSDLVIISSPMTRRGRRPLGLLARRRLTVEREALTGSRVVVVEPSPAAVEAAKGFPRRNPGASGTIVADAERAVSEALRAARIAA